MTLRNHFPVAGYVVAEDGSGHKVYYEEYGPKDVTPFVMVHGNMGAVFDPSKLPMWDFDKHHVIVIHARGIGNSTPSGNLQNNQYPDLADDIETVRKKLGLDKISLVGWSGGTAVSLLYAEKYPQNTQQAILYGTYLGTQKDIAAYYDDLSRIYPERWKEFCDFYGTADGNEALSKNRADILAGNLDAVIRYKLIFEPQTDTADTILAQNSAQAWQRILSERQVFANMLENQFGLESRQIEKNIERLKDIPVTFINGDKDYVTPPNIAGRLADKLPRSQQFVVPNADHDIHEPEAQAFMKDFLGNMAEATKITPVRTTELVMHNLEEIRYRSAHAVDFEPNTAVSANAANATVEILEKKIAEMEAGRHAIAVESGQAAIVTTLLGVLKAGDHVLLPDSVYGPVRTLAQKYLEPLGITSSFYDPDDVRDMESKISAQTKLIYLESPGSLTFETQDIAAIADIAKKRGVLTAIDNTWATPVGSNPLTHGIDIVIHSLSKLAAGSSQVFAGAIAVNDSALHKQLKTMALFLGHWLSPDDAVAVRQGLDTLPQRLTAQQESLEAVVSWLKTNPYVDKVFAPSDPDNATHSLWKKYHGSASSLFSFSLKEPMNEQALAAFMDSFSTLKLSFGWGGPNSLIVPVHPVRTIHDAPKNLIRMYVGREPVQEILDDLTKGFQRLDCALKPKGQKPGHCQGLRM